MAKNDMKTALRRITLNDNTAASYKMRVPKKIYLQMLIIEMNEVPAADTDDMIIAIDRAESAMEDPMHAGRLLYDRWNTHVAGAAYFAAFVGNRILIQLFNEPYLNEKGQIFVTIQNGMGANIKAVLRLKYTRKSL